MKEIRQNPGGRRYVGNDFMLPTETLHLLEKWLKQYGNFIINGCELTGNTLAPGNVMLDGKACPFDGANVVSGAYYVRQVQITTNVPYKTGQDIGYTTYFAEPCLVGDAGAFRLDNALRFVDVFKPKNAEHADSATNADNATNADTVDGKHAADFLASDGGTMNPQTSINFVPVPTGGNALGAYFRNAKGAANALAGIGALFSNQTLQHLYMGWGSEPWLGDNSFSVWPTGISYKGNKVWHEGNDGQGSGLDADTVDGKHAVDMLYKTLYISENNTGVLIKTKWASTFDAQAVVQIVGNGYGSGEVINTTLQFYYYVDGGVIMNGAATNVGLNIAQIKVFFLNSYLHIWLPPFTNYNTIKVYASDQSADTNMVDTIVGSAMPSGTSRLVTIMPRNVIKYEPNGDIIAFKS